jgi:F-type H+-transporting ATPase subunit b
VYPPDWTLPVASFVFLITLFALNQLLFKPLFRVLDERRERTVEMRSRAQRELEYHQALLEEYHSRIRDERQSGYRLAEAVRGAALEERQQAVARARAEAEQLLSRAKDELQAERKSVRERLSREADEIARLITTRVLQRS